MVKDINKDTHVQKFGVGKTIFLIVYYALRLHLLYSTHSNTAKYYNVK